MNIAGFYEESMSNGIGWRSVLFVSGCFWACPGCHNKKAWDMNYGEPYDEEAILESILDNPLLQGLTLSGGEPMLHVRELYPLVEKVKNAGLDVWCYTGFTLEELMEDSDPDKLNLLDLIDVLVDGRYVEELRDPSLLFRGSSNQTIIDMNYFRKTGEIKYFLE